MFAIAFALVCACSPTLPTFRPETPAAPTEAATLGPPTPEPTIELIDGLPATVVGSIVLRGSAIRAAIDASTDDRPFLVGGWFHAWTFRRSCPAFQLDHAIDGCFAFPLFEGRPGGEPIWVGRGNEGALRDVDTSAERPVVLRIHTHDRRCPADAAGCDTRPVLTELVWAGEAPIDPAPPREIGRAPGDGLSREQAIDAAIRHATAHRGRIEVLEARASQIWVIFADREPYVADQWVWAVTLKADFGVGCGETCTSTSSTELVVVDYVTGAFLEAELPAP